jgi:enolase-phosphatase E1
MIKAIVTDIEGTTSSLSFVKDVLFPYAREHMAEFVRSHGQDAAVRKLLDAVQVEVGRSLSDAECVTQLLRWIDEDKKITPLKALQGMIWEAGYLQGDFSGHVYEDAVRNLRQWREQGIALYVFSSGSVQAQRLIFGYSDFGDLTPLFSGYFDTTIGAKREADAYRKIAAAVAMPPAQILFLSDIKEELDAAQAAGMHTVWLVRDRAIDAEAAHVQVRDFDAVQPLSRV